MSTTENQITEQEKERIVESSSKALGENRPVIIETDLTIAVCVIANLQLAFRHPENIGPSRQVSERFCRQLIETIDPSHGDAYTFLMMGFDEQFDQ